MKNIPNILSISRIFLALCVLILYSFDKMIFFSISIGIIIMALITDILDGYIARKYSVVSENGYIWDGLGDRAFYIALYLIFYIRFDIEVLIIWLLIFREILIYALRLINTQWRKVKNVRKISLIHAILVRVWILNYLIADGLRYYFDVDISNAVRFLIGQYYLAIMTIIFVYYGIYLYIASSFKLETKF